MNTQFTPKFKLIFLPFLFIAAATVIIYTFLHWLLLIKLQLFAADEDYVEFFIPAVLVFIPVLVWVRPRLKLLNLKSKGRGEPLTGFIMLAWIAITAPTIIAQMYLETSTGELTQLDHISQISSNAKTRYYKVKHLYIDKSRARVKTSFEVTGRYDTDFEMTIYTVSPVYDSLAAPVINKVVAIPDSLKNKLFVVNGKPVPELLVKKIKFDSIASITVLKGAAATALYGNKGKYGVILLKTKGPDYFIDPPLSDEALKPAAWVAVKFHRATSNKLSGAEKQKQYSDFAAESQRDFDARSFDDVIYFDRIGPSKDLRRYNAALQTKNSFTAGDPAILLPVNAPFEARNGSKFGWIFGSFAIGAAIFLLLIQFKTLIIPNEDEAAIIQNDEPVEEETTTLQDLKNIFVPRKDFFITPVIIDLNIMLFVIMVCAGLGFITFDAPELLNWGANYRPLVVQGQYWRLFSSLFLHGGLMHVLFNMYGLLFVGIFLEPLLGSGKFLIIYLIAGLAASLASVYIHPATVSVGASGAIFGMYGVFLALLTTNLFHKDFKKSFLLSTGVFVGYNLLYGLTGGIDNAAHIGGLITGILIGYALYPSLKTQLREKEADEESHRIVKEILGKKEEE